MKLSIPNPDKSIDLSDVDLLDPNFYATGDPHAVWHHLRHNAPVYKHQTRDGQSFWAVTKYDDVCRAMKDYATFTSEQGTMLCILNMPDIAGGKMMAVTDPPRHAEVREPLAHALSRKAAHERESELRQIAVEFLEPGMSGEPWDFAEAVLMLPMAFMALLMGLPREDWSYLSRHAMMSIAYQDPEYAQGTKQDTLRQAHHGIFEYFMMDTARRRATEPGEGLIDLLMAMEAGGGKLSDEEILYDCYSLILGANVTTPYAATAIIKVMAENPEEYARWASHPELLTSGIEEGLRWSSPTSHFMRYASRDVEVRGELIREGDAVTAWLGSANRDEDVFKDPYRFDVGRNPNRHVAFGFGAHFCPGAPLARAALKILFSEILCRVERIEIAGTVEHLVSNFSAGIKHMPVRLIPR